MADMTGLGTEDLRRPRSSSRGFAATAVLVWVRWAKSGLSHGSSRCAGLFFKLSDIVPKMKRVTHTPGRSLDGCGAPGRVITRTIMSQSISRAFPGGPGKRAEVPVQTVSERVKRVEEIEDRVAERRRYLNRRARWHQFKTLLVASAVAAAGAGLYLGLVRGSEANGTKAVQTGSVTSNP